MTEGKYERINRITIDCTSDPRWDSASGKDCAIFNTNNHNIWASCSWQPSSEWTFADVPSKPKFGKATIWIDIMRIDMDVDVIRVIDHAKCVYELMGYTNDINSRRVQTIITLEVNSEAVKLKLKVQTLEKELGEVKTKLKQMGY